MAQAARKTVATEVGPTVADLKIEVSRAQTELGNAEAAYQQSLLSEDPAESDRAAEARSTAQRNLEKAEARLTVAKDREQARAEQAAADAKAEGEKHLADLLSRRDKAALALDSAADTLATSRRELEAVDNELGAMASRGFIGRNAVAGYNFGASAVAAMFEAVMRRSGLVPVPSNIPLPTAAEIAKRDRDVILLKG